MCPSRWECPPPGGGSKRLEEGTGQVGGGRNTCSRGRRDHLHLPVGDVRRGDTPIPLGCAWTIHALAPNNRTGVPMTGNFQRRRPLVSFLVSKSFGNQESSPALEREVGVSIQHQPKTGGLGSVRAANSDHRCCPRNLGPRP